MMTITLHPPLSTKIKEGLPCLYWDRLPISETQNVGGWLRLENEQGEFLSWGFVDTSNNLVHLISDLEEEPQQGVISRFSQAIERRRQPNGAEVCRWVNAAGDRLSGFQLDSYGGTFVLALSGAALQPLVSEVKDFLIEELKPERLLLKLREKGRGPEEGVPEELLYGGPLREKLQVSENNLNYLVQPMELLNVGLFFDLRGVRKHLSEAVNNSTSLLNLFSYTASFSLVAAVAGACKVVSVDTSSSCHAWAKENFRLNQLDPDAPAYTFEKADVFRYLEKQLKKSQLFDCIVLDPPARARLGTGRFFLKSDLPKLLAMCLSVLKPGGRIIVTDNTLQGSESKLKKMIDKGAHKAQATYRIEKVFEPESDFPVHPLWPKGRGVIAMEFVKTL